MQTAAGDWKVPRDKALGLTDADARETVGSLLTIGSRASNLPGRKDSARTRKAAADEAPVFYRPSSGGDVDGESVCGYLGDLPENSRAVFPLPRNYFGSYENTWGAARPQGGHEGTDLMGLTGTPEVTITDGTIVLVKGANENGWNRLGGYTVMPKAAYDAGPIEAGDHFYYAHMEEESALKVGTKDRAGQQIGVVGDTGEGREATRGKFPPHLHLGWYDAGSAGSRTNLESGAMNPYPLLLWLEEYGGSITGGMDVSYCEAPPEEPTPNSFGTTPDLDTGDRNDARPNPVVEEDRDGQNPRNTNARTRRKRKVKGRTKRAKKPARRAMLRRPARPIAPRMKAEQGTSAAREPRQAPLRPHRTEIVHSTHLPMELRRAIPRKRRSEKIRAHFKKPSRTDPASRRSEVERLVYMLHKAEKNQRDGRDAGVSDKKKQKKPKKQVYPPERKELRKGFDPSAKPRPRIKDPSLEMLRLRKKTGRKA